MKKQELINFLNQLLSNQFVMYVKLHRYYWYVQGEQSFELQRNFKNMYQAFAIDIERLAEHILIIEGQPLATMIKYTKETTLVEASADNEVDEIITQLIKDLKQIKTEISNTGIKLATKQHDYPTINFLVNLQKKLEIKIWKLQTYITF